MAPTQSARPYAARQSQLQAALRAGTPVFVKLGNGSVIGLQPHTAADRATLPQHHPTNKQSTIDVPARDVVRFTVPVRNVCDAPNEGHALLRNVVLTDDGQLVVLDLASGITAEYLALAVEAGFQSPLATEWRELHRRPIGEAEALVPSPNHSITVRTADNTIYSINGNRHGKVQVMTVGRVNGKDTATVADTVSVMRSTTNCLEVETTHGSLAASEPITEVVRGARQSDHPLRIELGARYASAMRSQTRSAASPTIDLRSGAVL